MVYSLPLFEVKKENPIETDVALWHRDSYRCGGMSAILVLGGGVIGLSMAMMLARQGHYVTVFERDSEPLPSSPEEAWQAWERRGVAQFRQAHYLHPPVGHLLDSHLPDVKEALLRAALELIAQKGPAGFTFAEAARWAGVSPAAPYRHFRDRDELLASVALRGFEQFAIVLQKSWDGGRPQPFAALDRLGKAYLEFARAEPAYYSAMFEAGISLATSPELREAGERAFAVLRGASEMLCARVQPQSRPPALMVALHIWAMSHGIASLFGRGDAARRTLPMMPEELLEAAVLVYLRGLGLASQAGPS